MGESVREQWAAAGMARDGGGGGESAELEVGVAVGSGVGSGSLFVSAG